MGPHATKTFRNFSMLVCSSSRRRTGGGGAAASSGAVPLAAMAKMVWQLRARCRFSKLEQGHALRLNRQLTSWARHGLGVNGQGLRCEARSSKGLWERLT